MSRQIGEIKCCASCPFFGAEPITYDGWIHGKCSRGGNPESTHPPGQCDEPECMCPLPKVPVVPVVRDGWEDITDKMSLSVNWKGELFVGHKHGDKPFTAKITKTSRVNEFWDYKFEDGKFWCKPSKENWRSKQ